VEIWLFRALVLGFIFCTFSLRFTWIPFLSIAYFFLSVSPILIILSSMLHPHWRRSNRTLFLLRLMLFPLSFIFPLAGFAAVFVHGLEYEQFMYTVSKRAQEAPSRLVVGFIAIMLLVALPLIHLPHLVPQLSASWIFVFAALALTVDHLHYYMDSVMFRFSDAVIHRNLAPVAMMPPAPTETNAT